MELGKLTPFQDGVVVEGDYSFSYVTIKDGQMTRRQFNTPVHAYEPDNLLRMFVSNDKLHVITKQRISFSGGRRTVLSEMSIGDKLEVKEIGGIDNEIENPGSLDVNSEYFLKNGRLSPDGKKLYKYDGNRGLFVILDVSSHQFELFDLSQIKMQSGEVKKVHEQKYYSNSMQVPGRPDLYILADYSFQDVIVLNVNTRETFYLGPEDNHLVNGFITLSDGTTVEFKQNGVGGDGSEYGPRILVFSKDQMTFKVNLPYVAK